MENKNNLVFIVAGLAVVTIVASSILSFNAGKQEGMMSHMDTMKASNTESMEEMDHASMSMDQMTEGLKGLKGDAFDKAFIEMMIPHHQGAVDMAELIPANAKHQELKKLGQEIITAQTKEIALMKQWMKDWGYEAEAKKTEKEKMDEMMPGMEH